MVENAYHILPVRGPQGAPPRTLIFKHLNFRDRNLVLREARNVGELKFENTKLLIFPDYSIETQRLRKSFDHVRTRLLAKV